MASAASYSTVVQELYIAYFGRPVDPAALGNCESVLAAANAPTDLAGLEAAYGTNATVTSLVNSLGVSTESANLYGAVTTSTASAEAFVHAVFESVLGRAPLAAGLTFWTNAITSGAVTLGNAALSIATGALANPSDASTIANKVAVAENFTSNIATI